VLLYPSPHTTNQPIAKLFPLEVSSKTDFVQFAPETQSSSAEETQMTTETVSQEISKKDVKLDRETSCPPEDVETHD